MPCTRAVLRSGALQGRTLPGGHCHATGSQRSANLACELTPDDSISHIMYRNYREGWPCRCGHPRRAHLHYRPGRECSLCEECSHFRPRLPKVHLVANLRERARAKLSAPVCGGSASRDGLLLRLGRPGAQRPPRRRGAGHQGALPDGRGAQPRGDLIIF